MGPGRDRTRDPWICSQTRICCQTRYQLRYRARSPRVAVDNPMALLHEAEGNSASGHPQHRGCDSFYCFTERYEIVVLLPNSELTKVIMSVTLMCERKTMMDGLFKLGTKGPITSLFVVRNIKCGYAFS